MIRRIISVLLLVSIASTTFATITKGIRYRSVEHPDCVVYALFDYHCGVAKALEQQDQLLAWMEHEVEVAAEPLEVPLCFVEDLFDVPASDKSSADYIEKCKQRNAATMNRLKDDLNSTETASAMRGFSAHCRQKGAHGISLEFRQRHCIGLAENFIDATKEHIVAEIDKQIEVIRGYRDNDVLNAYYADVIKRYYANTEFHERLAKAETMTIELITQSLLVGQELLNAIIMHHTFLNREHKKILLFFGGAHLEALHDIFIALGYTPESTVGKYAKVLGHEAIREIVEEDVAVKVHKDIDIQMQKVIAQGGHYTMPGEDVLTIMARTRVQEAEDTYIIHRGIDVNDLLVKTLMPALPSPVASDAGAGASDASSSGSSSSMGAGFSWPSFSSSAPFLMLPPSAISAELFGSSSSISGAAADASSSNHYDASGAPHVDTFTGRPTCLSDLRMPSGPMRPMSMHNNLLLAVTAYVQGCS